MGGGPGQLRLHWHAPEHSSGAENTKQAHHVTRGLSVHSPGLVALTSSLSGNQLPEHREERPRPAGSGEVATVLQLLPA